MGPAQPRELVDYVLVVADLVPVHDGFDLPCDCGRRGVLVLHLRPHEVLVVLQVVLVDLHLLVLLALLLVRFIKHLPHVS